MLNFMWILCVGDCSIYLYAILEVLTVSIFKVEEKEIVRVSEMLTVQCT